MVSGPIRGGRRLFLAARECLLVLMLAQAITCLFLLFFHALYFLIDLITLSCLFLILFMSRMTRPKWPCRQMASRKTNSITSATEGDPIVLRASHFRHLSFLICRAFTDAPQGIKRQTECRYAPVANLLESVLPYLL